jgi:hypothetical protein
VEQLKEKNRRMLQTHAAGNFEQSDLIAYQKEVALKSQARLIEQLEKEKRLQEAAQGFERIKVGWL